MNRGVCAVTDSIHYYYLYKVEKVNQRLAHKRSFLRYRSEGHIIVVYFTHMPSMNDQEAPKTPAPYSSGTIKDYYNMGLSFFISDFDGALFDKAIEQNNIILNDEQLATVNTLKHKAIEESESPIEYNEYNKILQSSKFALFVYIFKIINNWMQFVNFLEIAYPDDRIMQLFKKIDDAHDGYISTSVIMENNKDQFREHCARYRVHIAQILEKQKDNGSVAITISGAQKALFEVFEMMYINRDHDKN